MEAVQDPGAQQSKEEVARVRMGNGRGGQWAPGLGRRVAFCRVQHLGVKAPGAGSSGVPRLYAVMIRLETKRTIRAKYPTASQAMLGSFAPRFDL